MLETQPSIFDETEVFMLPPRRALLPWWIIFFSWLFIVVCSLHSMVTFIQYFGTDYIDLRLWGLFEKTGITFQEGIRHANTLLTIVAAYGLLKEKNWAVNIAIVNGLASVVETLRAINEGPAINQIVLFWSIHIFELIMLAIYLWKLFSIRKDWSIRQPRLQR